MNTPDTGKPLESRYANYFEIGFNAFEVLLVFGQHYAATNDPVLHTKIVTYPAYAQALLETLRRTIEQYEREFGAIDNSEPRNGER